MEHAWRRTGSGADLTIYLPACSRTEQDMPLRADPLFRWRARHELTAAFAPGCGSDWRNHSAHVACTVKSSTSFFKQGLISMEKTMEAPALRLLNSTAEQPEVT